MNFNNFHSYMQRKAVEDKETRTAEKEQEMHSDLKDFNSLNLIVPCDHFGLQAGDHVKFMKFFVKIYEMLLWPNETSSRVSQN